MYKFPFEKLEIWQLSIDFAELVYKTTDSFPKDERFGLISQMRRASSSVSANIAEGTTRQSKKEKARFIEIAYGSLMEVLSFTILALRLNYLNEEQEADIKDRVGKLSNKINAFHKSLKR